MKIKESKAVYFRLLAPCYFFTLASCLILKCVFDDRHSSSSSDRDLRLPLISAGGAQPLYRQLPLRVPHLRTSHQLHPLHGRLQRPQEVSCQELMSLCILEFTIRDNFLRLQLGY